MDGCACIGVPDEVAKDEYLSKGGHNPLTALIMACGDGHMGAVMALCPHVADINHRQRGICKCFVMYFF